MSGHHIFQLRGDGATLFRQLTETCPQEAAERQSGVREGVQVCRSKHGRLKPCGPLMGCLLKTLWASLATACHLQGLGDGSVGQVGVQQHNSTLGVQQGPEASRIDFITLFFSVTGLLGAPSLGSVRAIA